MKVRFCIAFILALVGSLTLLSTSASAASVYDDVVVIGEAKLVRANYCNDKDITFDYLSYIDSAPASPDKTTFLTALNHRFENGSGWALTQYENYSGFVGVALVAQTTISNAQFVTVGAEHKLMMNDSVIAYIQLKTNCDVEVIFETNPPNRVIAVTDSSQWFHPVFVTNYVEYPPGYEGEYIPSTPPTPPTTLYNGSVDCGVDSLEYMLITQDGDTNPVTLSYESVYRASWSHYLTDIPYTITVGCGSELATSYTPVTPMPPTSNDWICDTVNDPHYCVLS